MAEETRHRESNQSKEGEIVTVKYLQRKKARSCPVHLMVIERASEMLKQHGCFEKDSVVEELNYGAISDAIRWDYVREFLEADYGIELIPLSERFFTRHKKAEERVQPEKYLAMGNGKKTKGYALVEYDGGHLAIRLLEHKKALLNGVGTKYRDYLQAVNERSKQLTSDGNQAKLEDKS